jgi:hypothetical protein
MKPITEDFWLEIEKVNDRMNAQGNRVLVVAFRLISDVEAEGITMHGASKSKNNEEKSTDINDEGIFFQNGRFIQALSHMCFPVTSLFFMPSLMSFSSSSGEPAVLPRFGLSV